jgi:hypothetical protein
MEVSRYLPGVMWESGKFLAIPKVESLLGEYFDFE